MQSKLEFEVELKNKPLGKGKKKKPVAVPLTEFNARLNDVSIQELETPYIFIGVFFNWCSKFSQGGSSATASNSLYNGNLLGPNPSFGIGNPNFPVQNPYESDEELVERFRMEAKLEIERERQKAIERQLLMSRQPPPSMNVCLNDLILVLLFFNWWLVVFKQIFLLFSGRPQFKRLLLLLFLVQ